MGQLSQPRRSVLAPGTVCGSAVAWAPPLSRRLASTGPELIGDQHRRRLTVRFRGRSPRSPVDAPGERDVRACRATRAKISSQAAVTADTRPNRSASTRARIWSSSGSGGGCKVAYKAVKTAVLSALAASQARPASLAVMMTRSRSSAWGTRPGPPTLTWHSTVASVSSRSPAWRRVSGGQARAAQAIGCAESRWKNLASISAG